MIFQQPFGILTKGLKRKPPIINGKIDRVIYSELDAYESIEHTDAVSIKYVISGTECYGHQGITHEVHPGEAICFNKNERLHAFLEGNQMAIGLCIGVDHSRIQDVLSTITDDTLDNEPATVPSLELPPVVFNTAEFNLGNILKDIGQIAQQNMTGQLYDTDTTYYNLTLALIFGQRSLQQQISRIKASKRTTREELYRRIKAGKDYLHDNWHQNISIKEAARVANLSEFHFFRTFKSIHRQSPNRYLLDLRLEKARNLVSHSQLSLTDIALQCGFYDLPTFSRYFKRTYHTTPSQYRNNL